MKEFPNNCLKFIIDSRSVLAWRHWRSMGGMREKMGVQETFWGNYMFLLIIIMVSGVNTISNLKFSGL